MNRYHTASGIAAILSALALTGCTIHMGNFTSSVYKTGPTQTTKIDVPLPEDSSKTWDVEISPAVANVVVDSKGEGLIHGTATYNVPELKPNVTTSGNLVAVRAAEVTGVLPRDTKNDWNLSLGRGVPINLTVNTGASKGSWELGGLSLRSFTWHQGAADANVKFSESNPEALSTFRFEMGAARTVFSGLGNANFRTGFGSVGAGELTLYFDGELSHDVDLMLEGGASQVIIYSGGNPVRVTMNGALNATTPGDWTKNGKEYTSPEWDKATGSRINVTIKLGAGAVRLNTGK